MGILASFGNIFKVPDLKRRVLFTLGIIAVVRFGAHLPTPGIDGSVLAQIMNEQAKRLGENAMMLINMFSGGALQKCTLFALGVMPYISSTIILQLLTAVIPALEKMQKEGESGQKKIREWGRYGTLALAAFQAFFIARYLSNPANFGNMTVVPNPGIIFTISTVLSLSTGTILLMWLGEQITDKGIGNGISIIITINILSRLPSSSIQTYELMKSNASMESIITKFGILTIVFLAVIAGVVMITQGERRIPVQYAKRVVGRRQMAAGHSTHIPLRVNFPGVMPIIFASSILFFPATIASFLPKASFLSTLSMWLTPPSLTYYCLYVFLIVFFSFFWTATVFNPVNISEDLRRNSGFVPGIRPGTATTEFFDKTMTKITLSGAVFLAGIAIIPDILNRILEIPRGFAAFFGGTSLIIMVGVMLDTMRQIESFLVQRHYDGFMKRGRIKGRTSSR